MSAFHDPVDQTCIMCPHKGTKLCPNCKNAVYCSKDCQSLDWKLHKPLCRSFSSLPQRGPDQVRAVLFNQFEGVPQFVYLKTGHRYGAMEQQPITFEPYFPGDNYEAINIPMNPIQCRANERVQGEVLTAAYPDRLLETSMFHFENRALGRVTRLGHAPARGHIIGTRMVKAVPSNTMVYADVDMRDARNIVDRMGSRRETLPISSYATAPVLGTLVSCSPEVQSGKDQFRSMIATTDNSIYDCGIGASIPNLLGIPVTTGRFGDKHEEHEEHPDDPGRINPKMAILSSDINSILVFSNTPGIPSQPEKIPSTSEIVVSLVSGVFGFGSTLAFWVGCVGDGLVFRVDGKPFPKQHAEALIGFIEHEVMPKIRDARDGLTPNALVTKRQEILDFITRKNFEIYFTNMKAKRISEGHTEWDGLPSPYEITPAHYGDLPMMQDTRDGLEEYQRL